MTPTTETLRRALEPFAEAADIYDGVSDRFLKDEWSGHLRLMLSDLRRARAALAAHDQPASLGQEEREDLAKRLVGDVDLVLVKYGCGSISTKRTALSKRDLDLIVSALRTAQPQSQSDQGAESEA